MFLGGSAVVNLVSYDCVLNVEKDVEKKEEWIINDGILSKELK